MYSSYGGEFYKQREGAEMGSPVSAVVANLYTYIGYIEELPLESVFLATKVTNKEGQCITVNHVNRHTWTGLRSHHPTGVKRPEYGKARMVRHVW